MTAWRFVASVKGERGTNTNSGKECPCLRTLMPSTRRTAKVIHLNRLKIEDLRIAIKCKNWQMDGTLNAYSHTWGSPMRPIARAVFFVLLLTIVFVGSSRADTLYSYVGDTFTFVQGVYAQGNQITGSFVLSSSFVPGGGAGIENVTNFVTSFCFTDGHQTLTQANSTAVIEVGFNFNGTPLLPGSSGVNGWWYVDITTPSGVILTELVNGDYQTHASIGSSLAEILSLNGNLYPGSEGSWTMQGVPVPEGGTVALYLLLGLATLTLFMGQKRVPRGV